MKNWKKVATVSSAVLAAVVLAACSSTSSNSSSTTTASSTSPKDVKGTVTLWVDTPQVAEFKPIVAAFEKEYPNVKVTLTQSPRLI